MNADQLIKILQVVPPDTPIFGVIDGTPQEISSVEFRAMFKRVNLVFDLSPPATKKSYNPMNKKGDL